MVCLRAVTEQMQEIILSKKVLKIISEEMKPPSRNWNKTVWKGERFI